MFHTDKKLLHPPIPSKKRNRELNDFLNKIRERGEPDSEYKMGYKSALMDKAVQIKIGENLIEALSNVFEKVKDEI